MLKPSPADIAPALGTASRGLIGALLAKLASKGFRDMTPSFASLIPLLDARGARPTVLAQRAGITKQAISQLVRELQARGYVEQVPDPTDTRAKIVRLTRRGVTLRSTCQAMRQEINATALQALGATRLARLHRDLKRLTAALGELSAHPVSRDAAQPRRNTHDTD